MDEHEPPKRQSTFSADVDVVTSTVHARGELDLRTTDLLWGTIDVLLRAGRHRVTVDLAEVSSIDEAGVKLLIALQHSLGTHCGGLTIINAQPSISAALGGNQAPQRRLLSDQGY